MLLKKASPNGDEFLKVTSLMCCWFTTESLHSQQRKQKKDDDEMMEGSRLVFSSPFFRRLILARHLVPSASTNARLRTKALQRVAHTHTRARVRASAVTSPLCASMLVQHLSLKSTSLVPRNAKWTFPPNFYTPANKLTLEPRLKYIFFIFQLAICSSRPLFTSSFKNILWLFCFCCRSLMT